MAKQTKAANRTKAGPLPKSKRELSAKDLKKVKGGVVGIFKVVDKSSPILSQTIPDKK